MPKRKDDPDNLVTIKVRITEELKEQCNIARLSGLHKNDAESSFIRFLIELGLNKYNKVVLPAELSTDEPIVRNKESEMDNYMNKRKILDIVALLTPEQKKKLREEGSIVEGPQKKPLSISDFNKTIGELLGETDFKNQENATKAIDEPKKKAGNS